METNFPITNYQFNVSATSKADEIMHKIPYSITLNPDSDFNLVL